MPREWVVAAALLLPPGDSIGHQPRRKSALVLRLRLVGCVGSCLLLSVCLVWRTHALILSLTFN